MDVVIEQNGIVGVANHVVWRNRGGERVQCLDHDLSSFGIPKVHLVLKSRDQQC
jgi:hypothetical protein